MKLRKIPKPFKKKRRRRKARREGFNDDYPKKVEPMKRDLSTDSAFLDMLAPSSKFVKAISTYSVESSTERYFTFENSDRAVKRLQRRPKPQYKKFTVFQQMFVGDIWVSNSSKTRMQELKMEKSKDDKLKIIIGNKYFEASSVGINQRGIPEIFVLDENFQLLSFTFASADEFQDALSQIAGIDMSMIVKFSLDILLYYTYTVQPRENRDLDSFLYSSGLSEFIDSIKSFRDTTDFKIFTGILNRVPRTLSNVESADFADFLRRFGDHALVKNAHKSLVDANIDPADFFGLIPGSMESSRSRDNDAHKNVYPKLQDSLRKAAQSDATLSDHVLNIEKENEERKDRMAQDAPAGVVADPNAKEETSKSAKTHLRITSKSLEMSKKSEKSDVREQLPEAEEAIQEEIVILEEEKKPVDTKPVVKTPTHWDNGGLAQDLAKVVNDVRRDAQKEVENEEKDSDSEAEEEIETKKVVPAESLKLESMSVPMEEGLEDEDGELEDEESADSEAEEEVKPKKIPVAVPVLAISHPIAEKDDSVEESDVEEVSEGPGGFHSSDDTLEDISKDDLVDELSRNPEYTKEMFDSNFDHEGSDGEDISEESEEESAEAPIKVAIPSHTPLSNPAVTRSEKVVPVSPSSSWTSGVLDDFYNLDDEPHEENVEDIFQEEEKPAIQENGVFIQGVKVPSMKNLDEAVVAIEGKLSRFHAILETSMTRLEGLAKADDDKSPTTSNEDSFKYEDEMAGEAENSDDLKVQDALEEKGVEPPVLDVGMNVENNDTVNLLLRCGKYLETVVSDDKVALKLRNDIADTLLRGIPAGQFANSGPGTESRGVYRKEDIFAEEIQFQRNEVSRLTEMLEKKESNEIGYDIKSIRNLSLDEMVAHQSKLMRDLGELNEALRRKVGDFSKQTEDGEGDRSSLDDLISPITLEIEDPDAIADASKAHRLAELRAKKNLKIHLYISSAGNPEEGKEAINDAFYRAVSEFDPVSSILEHVFQFTGISPSIGDTKFIFNGRHLHPDSTFYDNGVHDYMPFVDIKIEF